MSTTISLYGYILEAMLNFTADQHDFITHSVLADVLCEITPSSVRLVSTDTHILGVLHLTAMSGYGLDICCEEPTALVIPVSEFKSLLKDRRFPAIRISIDDLQVTIRNSSGITATVQGRPAEDYPTYGRVIPTDLPQPLTGFTLDTTLLGKITAFCKTLKLEPHIALSFSRVNGPMRFRVRNLSSFLGVCMPMSIDTTANLPDWYPIPVDESRTIYLHDLHGMAKLSGIDDAGSVWTQFEVDAFAEQEPGTCAICGAEITSGWQCLDSGEEVCNSHVTLPVNEVAEELEAVPA